MTKKPERVSPKKFKSNTYERLIENIPTEILEWRKKEDLVYEYADDWFFLSKLFLLESNYTGFENTYYEEGGLKCQEIKNDIDEADQEIHLDKQGNLIKFKIYFYGYYGLIADVIAIGAIVIYFENNTFLKREIVPSETMEDYLSDDDLDAVVVVKKLYENYVERNEKDRNEFVKYIDLNFSEIHKKGTLTELSFSYVNEEFKQEVLLWHDQETYMRKFKMKYFAVFIATLIGLFLLAISGQGWAGYALSVLLIGSLIIFSLFIILGFIMNYIEDKKLEKERKKRVEFLLEGTQIKKTLKRNIKKISRIYRSTVRKDPEGDKNYNKFYKELLDFYQTKTSQGKELVAMGEYIEAEDPYAWIEFIEKEMEKIDLKMRFNKNMDPYEYEAFCATQFKKNKWKSEVTQASSDQGVDVVAKKNNKILVAQCKRFNKPVGNKAAQEVVGGIKFYKADIACVIAPNGFTNSAEQLAKANEVKLIHHSEIKDIKV